MPNPFSTSHVYYKELGICQISFYISFFKRILSMCQNLYYIPCSLGRFRTPFLHLMFNKRDYAHAEPSPNLMFITRG
jgi:hypothetical protein